ncbi:hypothetical protein [Blastococcus tunisiensis]|uniref:hypothetical protein n=1 Tax=Blastococcus tunisiensis TaxID=1798228 RepID=UPI000B826BB9|nr:hypothetical protein [Blastococcus sp. DSM 46838]
MSRHAAQPAVAAQTKPAGIELLHGGAWLPASILSWRTDDDGSCRVLVRLGVDGGDQTAWKDAGSLRTPQPADEEETQRMSAVGRPGCPPPHAPQRLALEAEVPGQQEVTMRLPLSIAVPLSRGGRRDATPGR